MELKVSLDQLFHGSMSFLQSRGLLAAFWSRWANHRLIVSSLLVRLALEAMHTFDLDHMDDNVSLPTYEPDHVPSPSRYGSSIWNR